MGKTGVAARFLAATVAVAVAHTGAAQAAFPGKPGPIAYSKVEYREAGEERVSGKGGIYVHGPRRREGARRLTTDLGDHSPSYSPDGRLIVFVSSDEERRTSNIYVMRNDGSERQELTPGGAPSFFPSGEAIVFVRNVAGDNQIFTVRLDGSGLRQLTRGPHEHSGPVVSPDGRRILFSSDREPDGRRDRSDIFAMRPDGSGIRLVIDGPRSEVEPEWAPNGRRVAFASNRSRGWQVYVARSDGRSVKALTRCRDRLRCRSFQHPVFSPDGRHIAALSTGTRQSGIEVMRSDGRGSYSSFDGGGTEEEGFGSRLGVPTWGPAPSG